MTRDWIRALGIRAAGPDEAVGTLSGGNQQKVALGRLLVQDADVLLLDEPTRGVDIGSKAQIYDVIAEAATRGKAVLMVSSYLPELFGLCDRLAVMSRGSLSDARPIGEWTPERVLHAAIDVAVKVQGSRVQGSEVQGAASRCSATVRRAGLQHVGRGQPHPHDRRDDVHRSQLAHTAGPLHRPCRRDRDLRADDRHARPVPLHPQLPHRRRADGHRRARGDRHDDGDGRRGHRPVGRLCDRAERRRHGDRDARRRDADPGRARGRAGRWRRRRGQRPVRDAPESHPVHRDARHARHGARRREVDCRSADREPAGHVGEQPGGDVPGPRLDDRRARRVADRAAGGPDGAGAALHRLRPARVRHRVERSRRARVRHPRGSPEGVDLRHLGAAGRVCPG